MIPDILYILYHGIENGCHSYKVVCTSYALFGGLNVIIVLTCICLSLAEDYSIMSIRMRYCHPKVR